jgi:hypothetical protein
MALQRAHGFRVIVYDQLGTSRRRPVTVKPDYTIDDMATCYRIGSVR